MTLLGFRSLCARAGVLPLLLTAGCAGSSPGTDPAHTLETMRSSEQPEKLLEKARAFAALGDTSRAEQYFAAAIAHGADETKVVPQLVRVCVRDGRYELAIDYAARYAQRHPNDTRMRYLLGTLYAAIGDGGRARHELEFVVTTKPNDPEPHWALAKVLLEQSKDAALADGQFREYLRLAPTGAHAEEARASLTHVDTQPSAQNR